MTSAVSAILAILNELLDGSAPGSGWVLNPEDRGLLRSLDTLSAEQASALSPEGGASIAAHVDHLRYGLELLNRAARGEDAFANADYSASWTRTIVLEPEWAARRQALQREANAWRETIARRPDLDESDLTLMMAIVAHLAYHLGAIRQIDRSTRGPSARD